MRESYFYRIKNLDRFVQNLAHEVENAGIGVLLRGKDNFPIPETTYKSRFDIAAAIGARSTCNPSSDHFDSLDTFLESNNDWAFGYFGYDLKNQVENLDSSNPDSIGFPDLYFFVPKILVLVVNRDAEFKYYKSDISPNEIDDLIKRLEADHNVNVQEELAITFHSHFSYSDYIKTVNEVKNHIALGDIYEMNLCQEFFSDDVRLSPWATFNKLYEKSPTPFGAFVRLSDKYLMCASPERYLRKDGSLLFSQPIKGTAPRMATQEEDNQCIESLKSDPKEQAENVMIVDLVRNDLSRIAKRGSVRVNELCGIYSFRQVHQMISTISCELQTGLRPSDPFKVSFPMGSMTGAPKVRAMELIEHFERSKRGLYSGAVGYFMPNGDFDFNVVIRSLLYNCTNRYLSFTVGGAITFKSKPDAEYRECLVKARAILETLNAKLDVKE
jgi:para-aminobenzoate synthetase component 1